MKTNWPVSQEPPTCRLGNSMAKQTANETKEETTDLKSVYGDSL